ncbi:MAG: glycoside hydrolase family 15 protein [Gammaproteobacteria bacterium]|nr:glycoside hydrolase family 15 protein [Gammaproteobacteria bacterium]
MSQPIKDYALLGNLRCAALVGRNGSIDWFCPPRFDAPACFSKLLGSDEHGFWQIAPQQPPQRIERHYQQDTLVLCTEFHSQGGRVRLTDYMPVGDATLIVRCVEGLEGRQQMRMQLAPRFGDGARPPRCEPHADGCSLWDADGQRLILRSDLPLQLDPDQASASFQIAAGQRLYFVLQHLQADEQPAVLEDMQKLLHDCRHWWRSWVSQSTYQGRWRDAVIRSLITLKALTYLPTGSMVAAPTTSLPEAPGRSANWDYRFCWIRDAVWALDILIDSNYLEEAHAWRDWLLRLMSRDSDLRVLYDLDGQNSPQERQLDWLPGHLDSRPVRSGNAARDQHQLDVYGQLIDLLHIGRRSGLRPSQQTWYRQCRLVDKVIACWHQPDEGIWELRGRRRHYIHSKVYAWVALDRSIRDAEQFKLHAPLAHWRRVRNEIHAQVCERGVDPQRGVFKQSYEDAEPDASVLMIPLLGFLPVEDPRVQATIDWIQQELQRNSLVYRFRPHRSEAGWEGSFIACSFWMVDNLIMSQRQEQAEAQFARLLALRNDVGLLAEQYHPQYGLLGNFPQALSHLALVKSAYLIQACEKVHHGGAPERHSYRPLD